MSRERLDVLVHTKGLAPSREKAKALIMAGLVDVNGQREDKPGMLFDTDAAVSVREGGIPYVSRGGLKLEKALSVFGIRLDGKICADAGASTGGFTDCMLQNGAAKVYAIDVGYGQLHWKLRSDPRVVVMEKTNVRYLAPGDLAEKVDFATADVSFISLSKVLPALEGILADGGSVTALIKPQFEAGREQVGKKGVVRDPAVHRTVIRSVIEAAEGCGLRAEALTYSPVRGPEGNIEYLILLSRSGPGLPGDPEDVIASVVEEAHRALEA